MKDSPLVWKERTFKHIHVLLTHLRDTLPDRRSTLWFEVASKDKNRIADMYALYKPQWRGGFQYDVDELYLALRHLEAYRAAVRKERQDKVKQQARERKATQKRHRTHFSTESYMERIGEKYNQK